MISCVGRVLCRDPDFYRVVLYHLDFRRVY